jgi:hypothetical protein
MVGKPVVQLTQLIIYQNHPSNSSRHPSLSPSPLLKVLNALAAASPRKTVQ